MRVVFTYQPDSPGRDNAPSPIARKALDRFAPDAEVYRLGTRPDEYYWLFAQLWDDGDGWLNVEQDIELHAAVLPETEACPEPWCVWPYQGPGRDTDAGDRYLYGALGCTRFSAELIAAHPQFMAHLQGHSWQGLDSYILPGLLGLGYTQHIHWPAVLHHHIRSDTGLCDCRQVH